MAGRAALPFGFALVCEAVQLQSVDESRHSDPYGPGPSGHIPGLYSNGNDCACMSWTELYYNRKAYCGRANELYFLSKNGFNPGYAATEPLTGLPHKVCWDFFSNFNSTACVNVDLLPFPTDEQSGKQWCYVSNNCAELNGGKAATNGQGFQQAAWNNLEGTALSNWKYCRSGVDDLLKDKSVQDIDALSKSSDVSVSRLVRFAYPAVEIMYSEAAYFYEQLNEAYKAGRSLEEMVNLVPVLSGGWDADAEAKETKLRQIALSGQPHVLDSPGHSDEFHVVAGRAVYRVYRIEDGDMAYLGGHFSKEFLLDCLLGCAQSSEPSSERVDRTTL